MSSKKQRPDYIKRSPFKPDIRVANAVVAAIAFLQKSGVVATGKTIKACINARCKKQIVECLSELGFYLRRGVELGILKKWGTQYKLGDFSIKKRKKRVKKSKTATTGEQPVQENASVEFVKAVSEGITEPNLVPDVSQPKSAPMSRKSSVCAF